MARRLVVLCFISLSFSLLSAVACSASVLIEKILRTNPDVGKVYVLIKAKDSEAALARLRNEVCMHGVQPCICYIHALVLSFFTLAIFHH
jgi:alcohol-forming fatty acyl-CoA reductase